MGILFIAVGSLFKITAVSFRAALRRTRRVHLWKTPTPNGLSRYSHFLADPCKRYTKKQTPNHMA
ncbi:hypothetical protein RDI58_024686 [Solanum bulbocastanum]|uniref:Uncharacterized protein n=1 Tax=Solanum bulbocastanum TaxID=147425 RepID=A0AAN8T5E2_SOLBU